MKSTRGAGRKAAPINIPTVQPAKPLRGAPPKPAPVTYHPATVRVVRPAGQ